MRTTFLTAAVLTLSFALPAAADAHVTVQPTSVPAGGEDTRLAVRVPNEMDNASTVKLDLQLPPGFAAVSFEPNPGWTVKVTKTKLATPIHTDDGDITEAVSRIAWTGDGKDGSIPPGAFKDFGLSVLVPGKAGGQADLQGTPDLQQRQDRPLDRPARLRHPRPRRRRHRGLRRSARGGDGYTGGRHAGADRGAGCQVLIKQRPRDRRADRRRPRAGCRRCGARRYEAPPDGDALSHQIGEYSAAVVRSPLANGRSRPQPPVTPRWALLFTVALMASCGGSEKPPGTAAETATPTTDSVAERPASPGSAANAYIGSIAVDPRSGVMYLGTGMGMFRVERRGATPERVVGKLMTPGGEGSVSSNLFLRAAGPGELLASGHPEGGALPENLGLIRSTDGGATWTPVAQLGRADYHLLELFRGRVVAVEAEGSGVLVSNDGGRSFEERAPPAAPVDLAVDPSDAARMIVSTEQGVFTSTDDGRSWRPRDAPASARLSWAGNGMLYAADSRGQVSVSADEGQTWTQRGTIGVGPNALAVGGGKLYASVANGEVRSSADGGKTWQRYAKLV